MRYTAMPNMLTNTEVRGYCGSDGGFDVGEFFLVMKLFNGINVIGMLMSGF